MLDILEDLDAGSEQYGLDREIAEPLLTRLRGAYHCQGVVELSAGLGTAVIGTPWRGLNDQDQWRWPLTEIKPWKPPVPMRGAHARVDKHSHAGCPGYRPVQELQPLCGRLSPWSMSGLRRFAWRPCTAAR